MSKITTLILFLIGLQIGLNAQKENISYSLSDEQNMSNIYTHFSVLGKKDSFYYALRIENYNQFYVQQLDEDLNLVEEIYIRNFSRLKTYTIEFIEWFNEDIYIFLSREGFSKKTLFVLKVDLDNLKQEKIVKPIGEMPIVSGNIPQFSHAISRDRKKLMIYGLIKTNVRKILQSQVWVYEGDMQRIWEKEQISSFTGKGPQRHQFHVADNGDVHILSLLHEARLTDKITGDYDEYLIQSYFNNGSSFQQTNIQLQNKLIKDIQISTNSKNELFCTGFYSLVLRNAVKGIFYQKINFEKGMPENTVYHEFGNDILHTLGSKELIREEEVIGLKMVQLIRLDSDDLIFVGEQQHNVPNNNYSFLVIYSLGPTGIINWYDFVNKSQAYSGEGKNLASFGLYHSITSGNDFSFFYNDHISNLKDENGVIQPFDNPKKSYLKISSFNRYSFVSDYSMLTENKDNFIPQPLSASILDNGEYIIPCFKMYTSKYKLLKVRFK